MQDLSDHWIVSALFQATSAFASRIIVIPNSPLLSTLSGSRCSASRPLTVVEAVGGVVNRHTTVFAKVGRLLAEYHAGQGARVGIHHRSVRSARSGRHN